MDGVRYLIVGGGMTGHAAAGAIREVDREGSIAILGAEPHRPYARPPLSKGLWAGKPRESVWLSPLPDVALLTGRRAVSLDPAAHVVTDEAGRALRYERLLLATGGRPRRLRTGGDRVVYFRTLDDYDRLRAAPGEEAVVIGGGFIGSEVAAALATAGRKVTMIFPEPAIGARVHPADLARAVTRLYEERGVTVLAGRTVAAIEGRGDRTLVRTSAGEEIVAGAVVAGLGIEPETGLAEAAGIAVGDGILVDERLRTSAPDVYAAGDVARFPCAPLGEAVRLEHEDAAVGMGRAAGRAMAGADVRYDALPFFYSDLFDLGYEAVGRLDARLETVASWRAEHREGVVYYLDRGRVKGVLLWGIFGQVDAARELVARSAAPSREDLLRAIP
jgi:3-phenylpropionate/trans-cinnamate dioxygenase ferredoxin reductase subunit